MTLTKAVKELTGELQRTDITEEEKSALKKYQHWLFGIKTTVSNNTEAAEFNKSKVYTVGPSFSEEMLGIIQKKVDEIASQYAEDRERFCRGMLSQALEKQGCFFGQWHPYPQEKPTRRGQYIVTALDPNNGIPYTIASGWWKHNGSYDWSVVDVITWSEMPKPYKP